MSDEQPMIRPTIPPVPVLTDIIKIKGSEADLDIEPLQPRTRFGTRKPNPQWKIPEGPQKFYTNGGNTYLTQNLPSSIALAETKHELGGLSKVLVEKLTSL